MKTNNKILPCFENFFLFANECCEKTEPTSGFTYEFLEGVDRETIAQIATAKDGSATKLTARVFKRAYIMLMKRLKMLLKQCGVKFESIIERINTCDYLCKVATFANADRGIRVFKSYGNAYGVINVVTVSIKAANSANVDIHIRDKNFNIIDTFTTSTMKDQIVNVNVNKCYPGHEIIYITAPNNSIQTYMTECSRGGTCCASQLSGNAQKYLTVDGFNGDQICPTGYGITACVEIVCDSDLAICDVKDDIALALLYQFGVELLIEAKATNRLNCFTMYSQQWFDDTMMHWNEQITACLEIEKDSIAETIRDNDNLCVKCCDKLQSIPSTS